MQRNQKGLTFIGLLVVGIVLAFAGIVVAQVVPTYLEYLAVDKAVRKAAAGTTVAEVRDIFDKSATIDNITSIKPGDLEIGKQGDKVVVSYDYAREIHLFGPAYLTMKYQGSSR